MDHEAYTDAYIKAILEETTVIAVIGASAKPERPSYSVMAYLLGKGYVVYPVNPGIAGQNILGQTVYAELRTVPAPVDMVDIFRNSDAALEVTRAAIACKGTLGIETIWMQLGVQNDTAAEEAEAAGLRVIMNRCPKIEYDRLAGGTNAILSRHGSNG